MSSRVRRPQVCHHFLRNACRYGSKCRFLHENKDGSDSRTTSEHWRQNDGPSQQGGRYNNEASPRPSDLSTHQRAIGVTNKREDGWSKVADWTIRFTGMKQSPPQMRFLWEEALDILEGLNPNLIQKVVERLVERDNIGRQYIEQVVNNDYTGSSRNDCLANSIPFLLFMTHPELINSFSIDRQVGTLYNYLYGTGGNKAVKFFGNLAEQLSAEASVENRTSEAWKSRLLGNPPSFSKALASTVECLRHTLRRNQTAAFNEAFKAVAEALCSLANLIP